MTILVLSTGAIVASLFSAQMLLLYSIPRSWLHWLIDATPQRARGALLRRLARAIAPYLPQQEIVFAEVVQEKRWKVPSCKKTVNTTSPIHFAVTTDLPTPETVVEQKPRRFADTLVDSQRLPKPRQIAPQAAKPTIEPKPAPIQPKPVASRLDAATLALDDSGLRDLLMVLGAKVPAPSTRQNLLSAVEAAIYRPTRKIKA